MAAYYNEIDPYAAQWIRNLIKAGHIAPGDVDERSIEDVLPSDLIGYTQCHFFAGVGVWSRALRQAGWPDDRPVWTSSCPCQPFSAAGTRAGFSDERHLWPALYHLITQLKPDVVFGEQVASQDALAWIDLVHTDLEAESYAFGAVDSCAAGFGAPHIRQRLYWVADSGIRRCEGLPIIGGNKLNWNHPGRSKGFCQPESCSEILWLANSKSKRRIRRKNTSWPTGGDGIEVGDSIGGLDDSFSFGRGAWRNNDTEHVRKQPNAIGNTDRPNSIDSFWSGADWLGCRDGKWRQVEPGTFPLANGTTSRVGRLRAYGNAINAEQAAEFISAFDQGIALE